jgi:FkbM family methyltransferase
MDKLLRTLQANFPFLLDAKFAARSLVSRALRRPHDADFRALALFPDLDGALYLDLGANRGQSIEAILMFTRRSCIWSFEPNPLLCAKLRRRFHGQERVVIKDFGLGDQEGAFKLYVPYYKKWMYDGLASLKREFAADWLRDRVYGYREEHLTIKEVDCRIRRLDDVLSFDGTGLAPFFIKLDVQGYELEALTGGERTLRNHEPILLIESPDEPTSDFLGGLGYQPYSYEGGALKPRTLGVTNTFFMTDGKAALLHPPVSLP